MRKYKYTNKLGKNKPNYNPLSAPENGVIQKACYKIQDISMQSIYISHVSFLKSSTLY